MAYVSEIMAIKLKEDINYNNKPNNYQKQKQKHKRNEKREKTTRSGKAPESN